MLTAFLAAAAVTLTIPPPPKLDVERLLDAIAAVENWDGKTRGAAGEWGPWQMTPEVWKRCRGNIRKTLQMAEPHELRAAAREELQFRIATLQINHHVPTAFLVALAWGAGVRATLDGKATEKKREYARRVETVYEKASI